MRGTQIVHCKKGISMSETAIVADKIVPLNGRAAKKNRGKQKPKTLGSSGGGFSEQVKDLRIPTADFDADSGATKAEFYAEQYRELCGYDHDIELMNLSWARIVRQKGTYLNGLYHIRSDQHAHSLLTRDEWTEFRKLCKESDSCIENYRHIAHRFPLSDRIADGYTVGRMLEIIAAEKREAKQTVTVEKLTKAAADALGQTKWITRTALTATDLSDNPDATRDSLNEAISNLRALENEIPLAIAEVEQGIQVAKEYADTLTQVVKGGTGE